MWLSCLSIILLLVSAAKSNILYVSLEETIDSAIENASDGDTIIYEDGDHWGTIIPYGKQLTIASLYLLDGDTSHIENTVIRPTDTRQDTLGCAVYAYGEPTGSQLIGLRLTEGQGTIWSEVQMQAGGALFIDRATLQVRNCIIDYSSAALGGAIAVLAWEYQWNASLSLTDSYIGYCEATAYGGGVYANNCSLSVASTSFDSLTCGLGEGGLSLALVRLVFQGCHVTRCCGSIGGLSVFSGFGVIRDCSFEENGMCGPIGVCHMKVRGFFGDISGNTFRRNRTGWPAVAISGRYSDVRFFGNVIEDNSTYISSGGLSVGDPIDSDIAYNIFRNNVNLYGGALYCYDDSRANIHHNTFTENSSLNPEGGAAIQSIAYSTPRVHENIITRNVGQTISSYFESPVRIDARNNWWGHESGPYHPTLNPQGQGDTLLSDSVTFIPWLTSPPDTTQPSAIRPRPDVPVVGTWDLQTVYPNPFNNSFTVSIAGFTNHSFELSLYNIIGQRVATLHSGATIGGLYRFTVSAELSSGVYFLIAHDDQVRESIKVVLLK